MRGVKVSLLLCLFTAVDQDTSGRQMGTAMLHRGGGVAVCRYLRVRRVCLVRRRVIKNVFPSGRSIRRQPLGFGNLSLSEFPILYSVPV
jgi:hypothetical protein